MDSFRDIHDGNWVLKRDLELWGLVKGNVTVPPGRELILRGMINGNLIVQRSARATIWGTVIGTVLNEDGHVEIYGVVGAVRGVGQQAPLVDSNAGRS